MKLINGIMEKKMEATIIYWGYIGIMEKKMETTRYSACLYLALALKPTQMTRKPCKPISLDSRLQLCLVCKHEIRPRPIPLDGPTPSQWQPGC